MNPSQYAKSLVAKPHRYEYLYKNCASNEIFMEVLDSSIGQSMHEC